MDKSFPPEHLSYKIKILVPGMGYLSKSHHWSGRPQRNPLTTKVIVLGCSALSRQWRHNILWKTEIKLKLTQKHPPCWLTFTVVEGTRQTTGGEKSSVEYPVVSGFCRLHSARQDITTGIDISGATNCFWLDFSLLYRRKFMLGTINQPKVPGWKGHRH